MALTPQAAVRYASTRRLSSHLTQAHTSSANVLRSSPAWSSRGVHSFFGSSTVAANDGLFSSGSTFSWGSNSPTVLNAAGQFAQFWDGREQDVEAQALGPLLSPVGMASDEARVLDTLRSMAEHVESFRAAFPGEAEAVTPASVLAPMELPASTDATPAPSP